MNRRDLLEVARQFFSFAVVGSVGFVVDASVFLALATLLHWPIAGSRVISVACAITATWALNRRLTFSAAKSPQRATELVRYAFVQVSGLAVNVGVFAAALWLLPGLRSVPVAALAIGSAAAMIFNFVAARNLAFRAPAARPSA